MKLQDFVCFEMWYTKVIFIINVIDRHIVYGKRLYLKSDFKRSKVSRRLVA